MMMAAPMRPNVEDEAEKGEGAEILTVKGGELQTAKDPLPEATMSIRQRLAAFIAKVRKWQ